MAISTKLCNPTPFDARIPYEKGIVIHVAADGACTLTSKQMDDYRPDMPGSESTQEILDTYGLFLEDPDLEYDIQALRAIRACIKMKQRRVDECTRRLQQNHIEAQQDPDPEKPAFVEKLKLLGMTRLSEEIMLLKDREKMYAETVGDSDSPNAGPRYDPERTCFATDPPREFASVTSLKIFLNENPEVKKLHDSMTAAEEEAQVDLHNDPDLDFE
jgi:hypothetical protein